MGIDLDWVENSGSGGGSDGGSGDGRQEIEEPQGM